MFRLISKMVLPLKEKKKFAPLGLFLTLLHSERPKLYTILAFLSAIELKERTIYWTQF